MLPKPQRLTRNFPLVMRKGVKIHTPFFVMRIFFLSYGTSRLAVSVSKKQEKTAVKRNRIRRRLIEAVKKTNWISEEIPVFVVLMGNSTVLKAPFEDLVTAVEESFRNAYKKRKGK